MQRLPLSTLRSIHIGASPISLRATAARTSLRWAPSSSATVTAAAYFRGFSTGSRNGGKGGVMDAVRAQRTKWSSWRSAGGVFGKAGASRSFMSEQQPIVQQSGISWQRFAWTAAGVAGVVVVLEGIFNRPTRDSLSPFEKEYLNSSFKYTGGGLLLTALAARSLFQSGAIYRIMAANPWVVLGVSLVGSIGSMMGVYYTPPEKSIQKHLFWLAFNGFQAATLSPLFFLSPAILSRAALYTVGVVGSLSYVGATATNDRYLYLGGPLLAGLTVVALSSLAPMVLPLGIRGLAISESISLYGGLAVFGGFVLYDTQKILKHAQLAQAGQMKPDALNESISLELDMINIFIRLVQILAFQNSRRK